MRGALGPVMHASLGTAEAYTAGIRKPASRYR